MIELINPSQNPPVFISSILFWISVSTWFITDPNNTTIRARAEGTQSQKLGDQSQVLWYIRSTEPVEWTAALRVPLFHRIVTWLENAFFILVFFCCCLKANASHLYCTYIIDYKCDCECMNVQWMWTYIKKVLNLSVLNLTGLRLNTTYSVK